MLSQRLESIFFTGIALIAFAANSILCRLALGTGDIDPQSFTIIRLVSGALTLLLLLGFKQGGLKAAVNKGSWLGGAMLFVYAITFSFAYVTLNTGTGALVLFGLVQLTMIGLSVNAGRTLSSGELAGVVLAFLGLAYLMFPSISTPSISGFLLMASAGIAWGVYSHIGGSSQEPTVDTSSNFMKSFVFFPLLIFFGGSPVISVNGVLLAMISGIFASALGYAIWYRVLPKIKGVRAAALQLAVPIIAALGGFMFSAEEIGVRFLIAAIAVLGGIGLVIVSARGS